MDKPYCTGDLVFAKMRGYPPWPAEILGFLSKSQKLVKYDVLFFGTYERGICEENNLFHYEQYKEVYGKPSKRRGFNEALDEIAKAKESYNQALLQSLEENNSLAISPKKEPEEEPNEKSADGSEDKPMQQSESMQLAREKAASDSEEEVDVPMGLTNIWQQMDEEDPLAVSLKVEPKVEPTEESADSSQHESTRESEGATVPKREIESVSKEKDVQGDLEPERRQEAQLVATKESEANMLRSEQHSDDGDKRTKDKTSKRKKSEDHLESVKRMKAQEQRKEKAQDYAAQDGKRMMLLNRRKRLAPSSTSVSVSPSVTKSLFPHPQLSQNSSQIPPSNSVKCTSHECKTCGKSWLEKNARVAALDVKIGELLPLKSQFNDILAILKKRRGDKPVSTTHSFGKEVVDGRVTLAPNITCCEIRWRTMNICSDTPDWCQALLLGTFGERDAMVYRKYPRYKDCKPFPIIFLDAAKVYYAEFIERRVKELNELMKQQRGNKLAEIQKTFFCNNKRRLISQIVKTLSDKAERLHKQWRNNLMARGISAPLREKHPTRIHTATTTTKKTVPYKVLTVPRSLKPRIPRRKKTMTEQEQGSTTAPCLQVTDGQHIEVLPVNFLSLEDINIEDGSFIDVVYDPQL